MKSRVAVLALFVTLTASGQIGVLPKSDFHLKDAADTKFHPGDIWEYKTRAGEEGSRLTVLKVDSSPELGAIVHIAVDNLTWRDCQDNAVAESIPHMPFARKAVDASVTRRIGTTQSIPDYKPGYKLWKEDYSKGHAGIYVIEVQNAVSVAETNWRSGIGCETDSKQ